MKDCLKLIICAALFHLVLANPVGVDAKTCTGKVRPQAAVLKEKALAAFENMENAPYLIGVLTDYIAIAPEDFEGYLVRAEIELEYGNCELDAIADLKKALQLNPKSWKANAIAISSGIEPEILGLKTGSLDKIKPIKPMTIEELDLVRRVNNAAVYPNQNSNRTGPPGIIGAPIQEPYSLANLPRPRTARDYFRLSKTSCSNSDAVIAYCNFALKINPNAVAAILRKAEFEGSDNNALIDSNNTIAQDPSCDGYELRARVKYWRKDYSGAAADMKTDHMMHRQSWYRNPEKFRTLLRYQKAAKQWQDAINTCSQLIALSGAADDFKVRASLYSEQCRFHEALQDIDVVVSQRRDINLLAMRSWLRFLCGQPAGSWNDFCIYMRS